MDEMPFTRSAFDIHTGPVPCVGAKGIATRNKDATRSKIASHIDKLKLAFSSEAAIGDTCGDTATALHTRKNAASTW